jgi:hypothetical protein
MYVADVTSMAELQDLLAEANDEIAVNASMGVVSQQASWDREDIIDRIREVSTDV